MTTRLVRMGRVNMSGEDGRSYGEYGLNASLIHWRHGKMYNL